MPAVGPFHDPSASAALVAAARSPARSEEVAILFDTSADVRRDLSATDFALGVVPVVALVETEIAGATWPARRSDRNGVEGGLQPLLVVRVRAGQRYRDRYAAPVGKNVSLGAKLCAISRIGSCDVPPLGALTETLSREAQAHSMPRSSS